MNYLIRDVPSLLSSPLGRLELGHALMRAAWPVLWPVAAVYRRGPGRSTKVIAVVGSYGKTTTTRAVIHALGLGATPHQTANCLGLLACKMFCCGQSRAHQVLEVGISKPGQMRAYARVLCPDITVVTSIGSEHNRTLGDLQVTRVEKSEMAACLPSGGLAVLNGDDANVLWMRQRIRSRIVTFGFGPSCDVRATEVACDWPRGMRFKVRTPQGAATGRVQWLGFHMIPAALAAIAVGLEQGVPLGTIMDRLSAAPQLAGRLQFVQSPAGVHILRDDFKGALETSHTALDALESIPLPAARKLVVLGDIFEPPGDIELQYRAIGERVARIASFAVLAGEEAGRYGDGLRQGGFTPDQFVNAGPDVAPIAGILRARAQPGDVVLIKGRGIQRLARVALALIGRNVRCDLRVCNLNATRCDHCPALEVHSPSKLPPWGRSGRVQADLV